MKRLVTIWQHVAVWEIHAHVHWTSGDHSTALKSYMKATQMEEDEERKQILKQQGAVVSRTTENEISLVSHDSMLHMLQLGRTSAKHYKCGKRNATSHRIFIDSYFSKVKHEDTKIEFKKEACFFFLC